MIVLDASSWVLALVDAGATGEAAREVLRADPDWTAPAHTSIEVLRTLRRYEQREVLAPAAAEGLAAEVIAAEVRPTLPDAALLGYVWQHRHNLSPYDAPYVALSVRHRTSLVTNDSRLGRAAADLDVTVVVPGSV